MPSKSLYQRTLSEIAQAPVKKPTGKLRFGMLPFDVMERTDISSGAKVILAVQNMEAYGTGLVSMSHSVVARKAGCSRPQVLACLKALCKAGLIEKDGMPVKQVQPYRLLHRDMRAACPVDTTPVTDKDRSIPVACPKCRRIIKRLPRAGVCRTCSTEARVEKTARRVAREEIATARTA
jgi:hypothetical protein